MRSPVTKRPVCTGINLWMQMCFWSDGGPGTERDNVSWGQICTELEAAPEK